MLALIVTLMPMRMLQLIMQWCEDRQAVGRRRDGRCQPNYRMSVEPDPRQSCGPYRPQPPADPTRPSCQHVTSHNHDTIAMIAIDRHGSIAAGASSNGASHKVPPCTSLTDYAGHADAPDDADPAIAPRDDVGDVQCW